MSKAAPEGPLASECVAELSRLAAAARPEVVDFCQRLVRTPSLSGEEEAAARLTLDELRSLGIEELSIDRAGNVIARLPANHPEPLDGAILLDAHLDVVDIGDAAAWTREPFGAEIAEGRLWGRGATDTKSAVAAQVHALALLRRMQETGLQRRRDVILAAVVQEEVGGLGTACFLDEAPPLHAALIGEPSGGALAFGHRGRVELLLDFIGRAGHAARPEAALSPYSSLAAFVQSLPDIELDGDAQLGSSSVAPTLVRASPNSPNVIPNKLSLTLDWRNVPQEAPEKIVDRVKALAAESAEAGIRAEVSTPSRSLESWTGVVREVSRIAGAFGTDVEGPHFRAARGALEQGLGREVPAMAWEFASDAGWLERAGVPCIGYGPGDIDLMHCRDESVSLDLLTEAVGGLALLALGLDGDNEEPRP